MEKNTGVTFADVAGVDEAKAELVEIVDFLKNPQDYGRLGRAFPRACCWSAHRAPARHCWPRLWPARRRCRSSPSPARSSSRCSSACAARVRDLFEQARAGAGIIFIDELMHWAAHAVSAAIGGHDEREQTSTSCSPRWMASTARSG
jgi:cell division protease FtsH